MQRRPCEDTSSEKEPGSDRGTTCLFHRLAKKLDVPISSIVAVIFIVGAVAVPIIILTRAPDSYTLPTQFLFDIILTAASIWIGAALSTKQAEKRATGTWIPAAESASKALLTMSAIVQRLRHKQTMLCESLEQFFSDVPAEKLTPIKAVMEMRCYACSESLSHLGFQIRNSFCDWDAFIKTNCDKTACMSISSRLKEKREELINILKQELPELELTL